MKGIDYSYYYGWLILNYYKPTGREIHSNKKDNWMRDPFRIFVLCPTPA